MWPASRFTPLRVVLGLILLQSTSLAANVDPSVLDSCPGYTADNVRAVGSSLTADLSLAGKACNVYGQDIQKLLLTVEYETKDRIHVKITDPASQRYEVPESVLPRPKSKHVGAEQANIAFNYTSSPFSFSIIRTSTKEVLFSTASHPIIFEPQYLRVKTDLPSNPNIYGLGEHSQTFHLPADNTTLTLWSRDAYGIPTGTNLYGNHPIYFEHRTTGTHAVFFLNSNGMDIKLKTEDGRSSLEYNAIGGVLDFYFLGGSLNDPTEVARQYAEVVGLPAEVPYWSFGLHQCRFGYQNFVDVANVITRYAGAKIPLETMWTDIDYMDRRRIFTVDPNYFPMPRMREIVSYLHSHQQRFILMTDPAVPYLPNSGYGPYDHGHSLGVFLKSPSGSESLGVVWPGVTVYPDWFHPSISQYWNSEFASFYNPESGLDIDGAWIDMNEPANFCNLPCDNPFQQAIEQQMPPPRTTSPPDPNTPIFTDKNSNFTRRDDYLNPPYAINNAAGALSSKTAFTDDVHANGLVEYNTHNLYGTMMSVATRDAMLARRPGKRTLIITRSTFAGAGAHVGKWLGDNMSRWDHYRRSIAGMLAFASIYQVPMVGSDICGFAENTTEQLCARWASLGAFYPFMRNHNADTSISQEFYLWDTVAQSARNALDIRYRLIDYLYTAFHQARLDGTPVLHPMWYKYPKDANTFGIDLQFFFGDSILVSPVTDEGATSVSIYLPKDTFFDFRTLAPIQGTGSKITLQSIDITQIPVFIKSGVVLPLRVKSQMTTTELRKTDFELIVAPNAHGDASGQLYVDDGESIEQSRSTFIKFKFSQNKLIVYGDFNYNLGVKLARVRFLNTSSSPNQVSRDGGQSQYAYDSSNKVLDVAVDQFFTNGFTIDIRIPEIHEP